VSAPYTILVNSRAGLLTSTTVEQFSLAAEQAELDVDVVPTSTPDEMCAVIRRLVAGGAERLAVAGGDGTIAHAVQVLAHGPTVLGILPQGTANNFATALRLPTDLPSAMRVLRDGEIREVDLGKVGGRYFTEAAGVGLFADVLALYGAGTNKNFLRALYAMTRVILSMRAQRLRLYVDGELHVERAVMATAANTFRMGVSAPMAPEAKVTDGKLDVVVVGDLMRRELLPYYRAIRAQVHLQLPKVSSLKAREVRIEAARRMNVHADDRVVAVTPVTITAQPGALRVLVDRL
jgi:YegS/Rv2252/BmrU family lipid kinase